MAIISSNSFCLDEGLDEIERILRDWLFMYDLPKKSYLEVSISVPDEQKQKKGTAIEELDRLIKSTGVKRWKRGDYDFSFSKDVYCWKGEKIFISRGEALFLYRKLVLKDGTHKAQRYLLQNMRRRRFNKEFLKEVESE